MSSDLRVIGFLELMVALKADPKGQALADHLNELIDAAHLDLEVQQDFGSVRFVQGRVAALRELRALLTNPEANLGLHQEMGKLAAIYQAGQLDKSSPEGD